MAEDNDNGLSDDEYDALLQDLEGRAAEGGASPDDLDPDEEIGDLDELLESEMDQAPEPETKTREPEDPELADEFAALEQEGGDIELSSESTPDLEDLEGGAGGGDEPDEKSGEGGDAEASKEDDAGSSRGKRVAKFAALNALWVLPAVALWWVLGSYLGAWISAGWLITLVGAMFVFVVPWLIYRAVDRGDYRTWVGGLAAVVTVALVAPMPNLAGDRIAAYGHWPSATIAEITQQDSDTGFVRAQGATAGWVGAAVSTTDREVSEPRQLGTIVPLGVEWPPQEAIPALEEGEEPEFEPDDEPTDEAEVDEPAAGDETGDSPEGVDSETGP